MRTRSSWDELLPMEEVTLSAKYLISVWSSVSKAYPTHFKYSKREPNLTERLHSFLVKLAPESGLTGKWINEAQDTFYADDGEVADRNKKDITYFSNLSGISLELIFEFKKLSKSSLATYRGFNGMQRFVDGNYGVGIPLAVMVALVKENMVDTIGSINRSLSQKAIQNELKMVHDKSGNYIRHPSNVLLGIAEFDTEHRRPPEKAPPNGTTTLAHIFLDFSS